MISLHPAFSLPYRVFFSATVMERSGEAARRPHFFKVLLPQFFEKLPIPPKFIQHLASDNPRKVTLDSPLGKSWAVSIQRDGPRWCFANGWNSFIQAHKLLAGFFVVFCYEGDMVFTFKAFDLSACEIIYTPVAEGLSEREIKCEIDQVDTIFSQSRPGSSSKSARARKHDSRNKSRGRPRKRSVTRNLADNHRAEKALGSKRSSHVKQPPQFQKILTARQVTCGFLMLPKGFCASHGLLSKSEVILQVGPKKGRSTVNLLHGVYSDHFGKGWKKFVEDNNLQERDTCIFKLVSDEKMIVQVVKP